MDNSDAVRTVEIGFGQTYVRPFSIYHLAYNTRNQRPEERLKGLTSTPVLRSSKTFGRTVQHNRRRPRLVIGQCLTSAQRTLRIYTPAGSTFGSGVLERSRRSDQTSAFHQPESTSLTPRPFSPNQVHRVQLILSSWSNVPLQAESVKRRSGKSSGLPA
jgi:hypothetical protein